MYIPIRQAPAGSLTTIADFLHPVSSSHVGILKSERVTPVPCAVHHKDEPTAERLLAKGSGMCQDS